MQAVFVVRGEAVGFKPGVCLRTPQNVIFCSRNFKNNRSVCYLTGQEKPVEPQVSRQGEKIGANSKINKKLPEGKNDRARKKSPSISSKTVAKNKRRVVPKDKGCKDDGSQSDDLRDFEIVDDKSAKKPHESQGLRKKLERNIKSTASPKTISSPVKRCAGSGSAEHKGTVNKVTSTKAKRTKASPSKKPTEESKSRYFQNTSIDMSDIKGLLKKFEGADDISEETAVRESGGAGSDITDSSDDAEDWEEVEELDHDGEDVKSQLPTEPVEITLAATSIMRKKRKKKGFDVEEWFRLERNRARKESQLRARQVHMLCLLARGFYRSGLCSDELLQAAMLSHVPSHYHCDVSKWGLVRLTQITTWFSKLMPIFDGAPLEQSTLKDQLLFRIQSRVAGSREELVLLYVCMLRALGLDVRLVLSLQPMTYKAADLEAKPKEVDEFAPIPPATASGTQQPKPKTPLPKVKDTNAKPSKAAAPKKSKTDDSTSKYFKPAHDNKRPSTGSSKAESKTSRDSLQVPSAAKRSSRRRSATKVNYRDGGEVDGSGDAKRACQKRKSDTFRDDVSNVKQESDSDFEDVSMTIRSPAASSSSAASGGKRRKKGVKIVSSDDSDAQTAAVRPTDINAWAEVFLKTENAWICVDCVRNSINCRESMREVVTSPLQYVIAFQQGRFIAKDVTQKYAGNWALETRKLRVDEAWWDDVMSRYKQQPVDDRDINEDLYIKGLLMKTPLPTSIGDYKGHPLFALQRHLLKFEGIYPPDVAPVGYIRNNEAVYPRHCVHTLRSRETWLKEARMVRLKEEPYKWVKQRPKKNQVNYNPEEKTLPVFGFWQTEEYIPPPAYDGKVPRNAYGNVELFKPCMLPAGTVHLQIPGLHKVARKLGIDCVAAMVGWEAHGGFSHPILDGFVVCEEFKDTLLAAWDEEQEIIEQREREKRDKRVIDNWTRLTKGLLIRKRLQEKYDLTDPHGQEREKQQNTSKKSQAVKVTASSSRAADDVSQAWPMNRQAEKQSKASSKKRKEPGPLFPFEVETM